MYKALIRMVLLTNLLSISVSAESISIMIEKYCFKCHSNKKTKGKLNFEKFKPADNPEKLEDLWTSLKDHDMPPEDEPQPSSKERQKLISWVESHLQNLKPKETPIRRLTRFEYDNSVRDLFGLKSHIFALPDRIIQERVPYFNPASEKMPDSLTIQSRVTQKGLENPPMGVSPLPVDYREENGFDNNSHMLNMSPKLMAKYLSLAKELLNSSQFRKQNRIWPELFIDKPTDQKDAETRAYSFLSRFLPKAFRKALSKSQVDRYVSYFKQKFKESNSYSNAMKETVAAALASPDFLYLSPGSKSRSDHETAAKLSYFLWGSIPDEKLSDLAAVKGELQKEEIVRKEAARMINDKKVKHLTYGFAMQWLQLGNLMSYTPDKDLYNHYYYDKRYRQQHAGQYLVVEPLLLFETVLVENRSITDFIHADYTFLNSKLLSYYKISPNNVLDKKSKKNSNSLLWKRVKLDGMKRGGILTSGACLTMTSTPLRSSPIGRGAWVSNVIFNDPPPPPPANVPSLDEEEDENAQHKLTIKERLQKHRDDPNCNTCHAKIDPLGFAFENFDAIGHWRDKYENNTSIDATGELAKTPFKNAIEFKQVLLEKKELFAKPFVKYILAYALNRKVGYADENKINLILKKTADNNYRLRDILIETAVIIALEN